MKTALLASGLLAFAGCLDADSQTPRQLDGRVSDFEVSGGQPVTFGWDEYPTIFAVNFTATNVGNVDRTTEDHLVPVTQLRLEDETYDGNDFSWVEGTPVTWREEGGYVPPGAAAHVTFFFLGISVPQVPGEFCVGETCMTFDPSDIIHTSWYLGDDQE